MADIDIDVGLKITPTSIRAIQSELKTAFGNISPNIKIDESKIKQQLNNAIREFRTLSLTAKEVKISDGAAFRLSRDISKNIKIKIDKLEAAQSAIAQLKRQLQQQAQVTIEAQLQAGGIEAQGAQNRAAEGAGALDTTALNLANKKAAEETEKLALIEVQLQLALQAMSKELVAGSSGLKKLKGAAARAARVQLQGIEDQKSLGAQRKQLATALAKGRAVANQAAVLGAVDKEVSRVKKKRIANEKEAAEFHQLLIKDLVDESRALKKFSGSAKLAAQRTLRGIGASENLAQARRQLTAALLKGRKVAQEELSQSVLNKEVARAKRLRLKSEREVTAANRRQAKQKIKEERSDQKVRDFAASLPDTRKPQLGSRDVIERTKAQRLLNKEMAITNRRLKQAGSVQGKFNNSTKKGKANVDEFGGALGTATKRLALYAVASQLIFGVGSALRQATDAVIKLDEQARRLVFFSDGDAFTSSSDGLTKLSSTADAVRANFEGLLQASIKTGLSLEQTTDILVTVSRVGQDVNSTFAQSVTSLVRLEAGALNAQTAVTNLNAIQIQFLDTLEQYNDTAEDAASLTEGISNVAAVLATTASKSAANVEQLSSAVTRVGSALAQIQGLNANATIAILGEAFNTTGANASRLGTSFRQLSTLIVQNADEIRELSGIEVLGEGGQIKGFESIIEVLERVNELKGTAGGIELLKQIADRRNLADVQALAAGVDTLKGKFGDFTSEAGEQRLVLNAVGKQFDADKLQSESFAASIEKLKAEFVSLTGGPIGDFLASFASGISEAISFTKEFVNSVADIGIEGSTTLAPFIELFNEMKPSLIIIGKGLLAIGVFAAKATAVMIQGFSTVFKIINSVASSIANAGSALSKLGKTAAEIGSDIDIDAETERTEELKRQIALARASQKLSNEQAAKRKRDADLAKRERERIAEIVALQAKSADLQGLISDRSTAQNIKIQARVELLRVEEALTKKNFKNTKSFAQEAKVRLLTQQKINAEKERETKLSAAESAIQKALAASTKGRSTTINIEFETASLDREVSAIENQILDLRIERDNSTGNTKERVRISKEIAKLENDILKKRSDIFANNIKVEEELLKERGKQTQKNASLFEKAGSNIAKAFSDAIKAQEQIADIFGRQGQFTSDIIKNTGEQTGRFLESVGASISARLANIRDTSARQISELRRTQRNQQRELGRAGDVGQAVTRVISTLEQVNRTATANLFRDVKNFERDVNILKLRETAKAAKIELDIRIRATEREIKSRRSAITQEISIIKERIAAERRLNDLRVSQQRDFGRLLLEAPDKFVESLADIDLAEQFFKGIKSLDLSSLTQISERSRGARGRGQTELLQRVLRGIQAASQFGRGDVASGIGNAQLQNIFERIQTQTPQDLLRALEVERKELKAQTTEAQRIRSLQDEMRQLDRDAVRLQEERKRLASAAATVAQKQRNDMIAALHALIGENKENFINLLKARRAQRDFEGARTSGGLSDEQQELLRKARKTETDLINVAHKERNKARAAVAGLAAENKKLADSFKEITERLAGFKDEITGLGGAGSEKGGISGTDKEIKSMVQSIATGIHGRSVTGDGIRVNERGQAGIDNKSLIAFIKEGIRKNGGDKGDRKLLRRLESEQNRVVGGTTERQASVLTNRALKDKEALAEVIADARQKLQDDAQGFDNEFIDAIKDLRGRGQRGAASVDTEALDELLRGRGFSGLADTVTTSKSGASVIDSLIKVSDALSENQKSVTRATIKEIKKFVAAELAKEINQRKKEQKEERAGKNRNREQEPAFVVVTKLENAVDKFSVAAEKVNKNIEVAFSEAAVKILDNLKEAGTEMGKNLNAVLENNEFKLTIPEGDALNITLGIALANGITSEQFSRSLVRQLKEAGFGNQEDIERLAKQIQRITAPLVKSGLITASPGDFTQSAKSKAANNFGPTN